MDHPCILEWWAGLKVTVKGDKAAKLLALVGAGIICLIIVYLIGVAWRWYIST